MEKFAVIDTETNWQNEVMSIGAVIADSETFGALEYKYYILTPEYKEGGLYYFALWEKFDFLRESPVCERSKAISDLRYCLSAHGVTKLFAYNAAFDYSHLPELKDFTWYDIMKMAAYRQYNSFITTQECCSTGRLKRNFGVESIKYMLTGLCGEKHNAISDAVDELTYIMKPLGRKIDEYIPYIPKK